MREFAEDRLKTPSRLALALPLLVLSLKRTVGALVAGILVQIGVISVLLDGTGRFNAIILGTLAVNANLGTTVRDLCLGVPMIIATAYLTTWFVSGLAVSQLENGLGFVLIFIGVWFLEFGFFFIYGISRKLTISIYVSTILSHVLNGGTANDLNSLCLGLALGCCGALIGTLVPFGSLATGGVNF
jgi:hypothetical protein